MPRYVVLAVNSNGATAVFGTKRATPFGSSKSAERAAARYRKAHPVVGNVLVLEIEAEDDA